MSRHFEWMQEIEHGKTNPARRIVDPKRPPATNRGSLPARPTVDANFSLAGLATEHWRTILFCMAIGIFLAIVATLVLPKKYSSEVQFLVKNERKDLTITPAQNAQISQLSDLSEEDVNSEMQMLLSHDLLEAVVLDNHLYKLDPADGGSVPGRRTIELGVLKLKNNLDISALRKTNVIQAKYRATSPTVAAAVLEDLSRRYLNAHLAAHSTPGSYSFFSSELARYHDRFDQAEKATSDFRLTSRIFNAEQQRAALIAQLEDVEDRYQNVDAELREKNARLSAASAEEKSASTRIPAEERTSVNQLTIDHLQSELADMENRRISLLMKFRPGDRTVQELDGEIANTRQNLASAKVEYAAEKTTAANPLRQTLSAMQSNDRIDIDALNARRSALAAMKVTNLAALKTFDERAVTLGNLQQDQDIAQQNYMSYSKRFEEARLADQMDKEKFANVFIIEKPIASPLSVSPKLLPNLFVGSILGIFVGFVVAFFRPVIGRMRSVRADSAADQVLRA